MMDEKVIENSTTEEIVSEPDENVVVPSNYTKVNTSEETYKEMEKENIFLSLYEFATNLRLAGLINYENYSQGILDRLPTIVDKQSITLMLENMNSYFYNMDHLKIIQCAADTKIGFQLRMDEQNINWIKVCKDKKIIIRTLDN